MKKWWLVFLVIVLFSSFVVYSQTKPSGDPPRPFWSPAPTTAQSYINVICGGGGAEYQAWCAWLILHPGDVPESYYKAVACTPNWQCFAWSACTLNQQARTCTDINYCGTSAGKPAETQSCTPSSLSVSISELKTVLISMIQDYFSSQTPKLTVDEIKDLIIAYLQTSGSTADLSGNGKYSGEKLTDIYNKAKGTTCIPDCTGKCGGASNGCGGTCNASCGLLGSKTNPVSINKFYGGRSLIYYPSTGTNGSVIRLGANSKTYFVVDSLAATGKSVSEFYFIVKGYNNADLVYTIVPQSKATGQDLVPEGRIKYGVLDAYDVVEDNKPYDLDNTKFLYAIENRGPSFDVDVVVQFTEPTPTPVPIGLLGSKTNPLKLNTPTPKYPNTRYATAASALNEGELTLAPKSKTYFVIDPLETKGISVPAFSIQVYTYNDWYTICKGILQDKITGNFIKGGDNEDCRLSSGFVEVVYDNGKPYNVENDNTRFIYAIENNLSNTAPINVVADIQSPIPTPIPAPTPLPTPSGALGSKTNPLKLNTPTPKYPNTRYATAASALNEGVLVVAPGSKTYFVIDPLETKGISVSAFAIQVMTYNQGYTFCKAILQDKITGNIIDNEVCRESVGFKEIVYDNDKPYFVEIDNTRFIYAIYNNLNRVGGIIVYAEIQSPVPTPTPPAPSGPLGSKTNPYKINKSTSRVSNGYIPENTVDTGLAPGMFVLPAGGKYYFEVDPVATIGTSVGAFKVGAVFYSGGGTVCMLTQDKITGAYSSEDCRGYTGLREIVYDGQPYPISNKKFLYAIDNRYGGGAVNDAIYAVIPFIP